jgi:hypothetical protein
MAFAWKRCDFGPLAHWTGGASAMIALAGGGDATAALPGCCKHRRCRVDGNLEPVSRPGPAVGKISLSPPPLPTKHRRTNSAHLNLFSWGRCLSVDRRRHPVNCRTGDKIHRLPRMPCPPQEKGPFCLLFCGRLDKKCGVRRDATRGLAFPLRGDPDQP